MKYCSYYPFVQPNVDHKLLQLEQKFNNMKLMYRPPNSNQHQPINQVFDEIFRRLDQTDRHLLDLEKLMLERPYTDTLHN